MIDVAWRAVRDGTVFAGLAGLVALFVLGLALGGVDLLGRRLSCRFGRRHEKPRRTAAWYDELIRVAASDAARAIGVEAKAGRRED